MKDNQKAIDNTEHTLNYVEEITPMEQPAAVSQMEELNLPEGKTAIRCKACNNAVVVDKKTGVEQLMQQWDIDDLPGIKDAGFQCPICKKWYHSFYTCKSLDSLRREAELENHPRRRSALRGKYSRKFIRFQEEVKRRLAVIAKAQKLEMEAEAKRRAGADQ